MEITGNRCRSEFRKTISKIYGRECAEWNEDFVINPDVDMNGLGTAGKTVWQPIKEWCKEVH